LRRMMRLHHRGLLSFAASRSTRQALISTISSFAGRTHHCTQLTHLGVLTASARLVSASLALLVAVRVCLSVSQPRAETGGLYSAELMAAPAAGSAGFAAC